MNGFKVSNQKVQLISDPGYSRLEVFTQDAFGLNRSRFHTNEYDGFNPMEGAISYQRQEERVPFGQDAVTVDANSDFDSKEGLNKEVSYGR